MTTRTQTAADNLLAGIPTPEEIRRRLSELARESSALRSLLRVAERAERAKAAHKENQKQEAGDA